MTQHTKYQSAVNNPGFLQQATRSIQLLFDSRVPSSLKLMLPAAAMLYWVWPIDLMPGLPFDDVAVLIGAMALFAKLAGEAVARQQAQTHTQGQPSKENTVKDDTVVDTTWKVIE